jgi:SAM-dependent methyltransferase
MNDTFRKWDEVYSRTYMTNWYPNEDIIRFCSRLIQKRLTYDRYQVHRHVQDVLDLGCGNGRHALYFARQGFNASGIDISPQAIEWARDWAEREMVAVNFRVGDVTQLPYADDSFDVIVSHGVLDHMLMSDAKATAKEAARVLRPGGLFYLDLRSADDLECGMGEEVAPHTFVVPDGFEEGLAQHFFDQAELQDLIAGLFEPLYIETHDTRLAPDFKQMIARWIVALQRPL